MCFSPFASFLTAGVTGIIGVAALRKAGNPRELMLAATPLVFAVQQGIEGMLWLNLPSSSDAAAASLLTPLFLFFADVFWPIYAPVAVLLIEPNVQRRGAMGLCLVAGISVAAYLLFKIMERPPSATIEGAHIVYNIGNTHPVLVAFGYLAATGLPLMLSSLRTVSALGAIVLVGAAIAFITYWRPSYRSGASLPPPPVWSSSAISNGRASAACAGQARESGFSIAEVSPPSGRPPPSRRRCRHARRTVPAAAVGSGSDRAASRPGSKARPPSRRCRKER